MKKAIIILEARTLLGSGLLSNANNLRNFVEINLGIPLLIKKLNKNYEVTIISPDEIPTKNNVRIKGLPITETKTSEGALYSAQEASIKLANQWYLYGDLPRLLQISGINIGEALQGEMIGRFFSVLKQIEIMNSLFEDKRPDVVYLESNLFPSARAFQAVASARGIEYHFIEPSFYRKAKSFFRLYLNYQNFKSTLRQISLYKTENRHNELSTIKMLVDTPYVNWFTTALPVLQEIQKKNIYGCFILGNEFDVTSGIKGVKRLDIKCRHIAYYKFRSRKIREYFNEKLKYDASFHELFVYKGVHFWEALRDDIDHMFDKKITDMIINMAQFHEIVSTLKPDILVLGSGDKATGIASHALLARRKFIPVLEIQHGVTTSEVSLEPTRSDKVAIGGVYWKRVYENAGARDEQLVVTGWPKYDVYSKLMSQRKETRNIVNILFATQPMNNKLNVDIIGTIGSFVEGSESFRLIVKPHPAESMKIYYNEVRNHKNVILAGSRENTAKLIMSSDMVVVLSSTVGIEAAIADKPIICITSSNSATDPVYLSSEVAIRVNKLDDIIPAIKAVQYNEEVRARLAEARKQFVFEHAYLQDGQASKRVSALIQNMIEESHKNKIKNEQY